MIDRQKAMEAAEAANKMDQTTKMAVNSNLTMPLMLTAGPGGAPPHMPPMAVPPTGYPMQPHPMQMPPAGYPMQAPPTGQRTW